MTALLDRDIMSRGAGPVCIELGNKESCTGIESGLSAMVGVMCCPRCGQSTGAKFSEILIIGKFWEILISERSFS